MTQKDISTIHRLLGNIEGVAFACDENIRDLLLDSVCAIDEVLTRTTSNQQTKQEDQQ